MQDNSRFSATVAAILQELQEETHDRVILYLQRNPYPDGNMDRNNQLWGFCGMHNSWTMSYFLLKLSNLPNDRLSEKFWAAVPCMAVATYPQHFHFPLSLTNVLLATTVPVRRSPRIEPHNCHTPGETT